MYKVYERGANYIWELLSEEYNDIRYLLEGIDSNDRDYIRELEKTDPEYLEEERKQHTIGI